MAVVKKHWKLALLNLFLVLTAGLMAVFWLQRATIHADAPGEPPGGNVNAPAALDPLVYSRIAELRRELALTNVDLSAMGCSQPVTHEILTQLVNWTQENKDAWTQAELSIVQSGQAVADAFRRMNVGPHDPSLETQIISLKASQSAAEAAKGQLLASVAEVVQARFSPQQQQIWQDARANKSLPEEFRYAASLTTQEKALINSAYANHGSASRAGRRVAEQLLGGNRSARAATIQSNRVNSQGGVCDAEQQVIVPPVSMTPAKVPLAR